MDPATEAAKARLDAMKAGHYKAKVPQPPKSQPTISSRSKPRQSRQPSAADPTALPSNMLPHLVSHWHQISTLSFTC